MLSLNKAHRCGLGEKYDSNLSQNQMTSFRASASAGRDRSTRPPPEPRLDIPSRPDLFFFTIGAIIRPTELDMAFQLHFSDPFSGELAFRNWESTFLEYVVEHTTDTPQSSSPSVLSAPKQVSAHWMRIAQPDHNGRTTTTTHILASAIVRKITIRAR